jgi:hypothetical protein
MIKHIKTFKSRCETALQALEDICDVPAFTMINSYKRLMNIQPNLYSNHLNEVRYELQDIRGSLSSKDAGYTTLGTLITFTVVKKFSPILRQQHFTKTSLEKQMDITEFLQFMTTQNHFSNEIEKKRAIPFNKTKESMTQTRLDTHVLCARKNILYKIPVSSQHLVLRNSTKLKISFKYVVTA